MAKLEGVCFIIGSPRSGTTIFKDLVSLHPDLSWPSQFVNRAPILPQLSFLSRFYDWPITRALSRRHYYQLRRLKVVPKPVEAWGFFGSINKDFHSTTETRNPSACLNLTSSQDQVEKLRSKVKKIQRYQGKSKFIAKYTDLPRIDYLTTAFPKAKFIHVIRDGRAVVNSMLRKTRTSGWFPEEVRGSWLQKLPEDWSERVKSSESREVSFLAYWYRFVIGKILTKQKELPEERTVTVKYSSLVSKTDEVLETILEFLGLKWQDPYRNFVKRTELTNRNYKWKENLEEEQKKTLARALEGFTVEPVREV